MVPKCGFGGVVGVCFVSGRRSVLASFNTPQYPARLVRFHHLQRGRGQHLHYVSALVTAVKGGQQFHLQTANSTPGFPSVCAPSPFVCLLKLSVEFGSSPTAGAAATHVGDGSWLQHFTSVGVVQTRYLRRLLWTIFRSKRSQPKDTRTRATTESGSPLSGCPDNRTQCLLSGSDAPQPGTFDR